MSLQNSSLGGTQRENRILRPGVLGKDHLKLGAGASPRRTGHLPVFQGFSNRLLHLAVMAKRAVQTVPGEQKI